MNTMTRASLRRLAAGLGIATALLVAAPSVLAADRQVDMSGNAFSPGSVTVEVGDTVTWTNDDARGHTATADGGAWDTGPIAGNSSGSLVMDAAGTFPYHCQIHPDMKGTVVVAAAAATAPPTDALAPDPARGPTLPAVLSVLALAGAAGLVGALRRLRRGGPAGH